MTMEQFVMKIFNLFIAPLLVIFLPLQTAIITLGVFFLINILVQMLLSIRKRRVPYWRIDKYIDDDLISYILKTITSYTITILAVSLFEVHIIGMQGIELAGQMISLTRAVVILTAAQQLGRAMHATEELTGFRLFNILLKHTPQYVKELFTHKDIYKQMDDDTELIKDSDKESIDEEEKTS